MHDGTRGYRKMTFATSADINVFSANPIRLMAALGTNKTLRPFHLKQILVTGFLRSESFFKFDLAFWKVFCDIKIFVPHTQSGALRTSAFPNRSLGTQFNWIYLAPVPERSRRERNTREGTLNIFAKEKKQPMNNWSGELPKPDD